MVIRVSDNRFDPWAQFAYDVRVAEAAAQPTSSGAGGFGGTAGSEGEGGAGGLGSSLGGSAAGTTIRASGGMRAAAGGTGVTAAPTPARTNIPLPAQAVLRALARGGSSAEATVRDRGDERKSSLPGGKRTRRRAEFGVQGGTPYRTGVRI